VTVTLNRKVRRSTFPIVNFLKRVVTEVVFNMLLRHLTFHKVV